MTKLKEVLGSISGNLSKSDAASIGRGILIAVAGALATEITKQLTGANFVIHWNSFNIGPAEFAAGTYDATLLVWVAWSAAVNTARKWATDTRYAPIK
jgi:hypothetical protein